MIKKVLVFFVSLFISIIIYFKGYNDGINDGYLFGFYKGIKRGRIQELINQGHTIRDAIFIVNNQNLSGKVTDEELDKFK